VYHVQIRDGHEIARAFNLDLATVQRQFLEPLSGDRLFKYADKEWDPRRIRLTVLEGRKLHNSDMMIGRGWQSAEKDGTDVTAEVLAQGSGRSTAPPPPITGDLLVRLKDRVIGRLGAGPLALSEVIELTGGDLLDGHRFSERVAAAEQAIWELLHAQAVQLQQAGAPVPPEAWQEILLGNAAWLHAGAELVALG
jgi:hypothetical protein